MATRNSEWRTYLVWCADRGETLESAERCDAGSVPDAAEHYASTDAGFNADPFKEIRLYVREAENEAAHIYVVQVEVYSEPVFQAVSMVPVKEGDE